MLDKIANVVRNGARDLPPAYFALVMATGIVSIAAKLENMPQVAWALFGANILFYAVLWLLTLIRLFSNFPGVAADLTSHERGHGFFTLVAGTCVLGRQFYIIAKDPATAVILWLVGFTLWCILMYTFIAAVTVRETKPSLENGLSGGWLLLVVSTQSITVTGASIAENFGRLAETILFLTLSMFLLGFLLYILVICLIFYRFTFFKFKPEELTPPYWINMGAMAISALTGALLILNSHDAPFLLSQVPFIRGFTVFYWATGTWWIPMLLILGIWRHGYRRFPLKYDPLYWGAVFPLGMYATSTHQMIQALGLDFLRVVPEIFVWVALVVWTLVFAGFARHLLQQVAGFRLPGRGT